MQLYPVTPVPHETKNIQSTLTMEEYTHTCTFNHIYKGRRFFEFEARLVYRARYRTAVTTRRNIVLKNHLTKKHTHSNVSRGTQKYTHAHSH